MQTEIIEAVKAAGFKVYMRDPSDTWMIYADGDKLAYLQADRWGYAKISTLHKPVQGSGNGSGFGLDGIPNLSRDQLTKGFAHGPAWAGGLRVEKYKGIEEYKSQSSWNAAYQEV